jgi:hypothetical protein
VQPQPAAINRELEAGVHILPECSKRNAVNQLDEDAAIPDGLDGVCVIGRGGMYRRSHPQMGGGLADRRNLKAMLGG